MNHGSLFSGIGGFDLAADSVGWDNIFHCEISEFPRKILNYYWPNAISYDNIYTTDFSVHRGSVDIISGGFPCQPFSTAGNRLGTEDSRYLWPEMLRAIREVRPRWVVGENVYGLVNWNGGLVFDTVCADLENEGFKVIPIILPAVSINAPHKRNRIFFIAHSNHEGGCNKLGGIQKENGEIPEWNDNAKLSNSSGEYASNSDSKMLEHGYGEGETIERAIKEKRIKSFSGAGGWETFPTQSPICRRDDELSARLDGITFSRWRKESIKGYGNAVVPDLVTMIFKTIQEYENNFL